MFNILITGADGQLGQEFKNLLVQFQQYSYFFTDKDELDVTNYNDVELYLKNNQINIIINCAGYTNVDKAQQEPDFADKINNLAVENLAILSKEYRVTLVHISTDYVFDGNNNIPYKEDDKPNPKSIYGKTKLLGESAIFKANPDNCIIIRTSWLYSNYGNNFVKTMLKLGQQKEQLNVVCDQIGTPTNAADLSQTILKILPRIKNQKPQIYHYSDEGVASWADFATAIMQMAKLKCKINPILSQDYATVAPRPLYSVLDKTKIKQQFNLKIPQWSDSLKRCLKIILQ
ncbi:MAG: dTDP-4-dehydrorhamnose reductase [Gammaproteobacteria bacterium]|nr:MAG: dTDP-4-dehydrorhamnose reductase [Gammaproteobacteria bacterium]